MSHIKGSWLPKQNNSQVQVTISSRVFKLESRCHFEGTRPEPDESDVLGNAQVSIF